MKACNFVQWIIYGMNIKWEPLVADIAEYTTAALFSAQIGGCELVFIQLSVWICNKVLYCKAAVAAESLKRASWQLLQLHKSRIMQDGWPCTHASLMHCLNGSDCNEGGNWLYTSYSPIFIQPFQVVSTCSLVCEGHHTNRRQKNLLQACAHTHRFSPRTQLLVLNWSICRGK